MNSTERTATLDPGLMDEAPVSSAAGRRSRLRRLALIVAGAAVALAAVLWLREWWTVGRFLETTDDAFVAADITTIASKVPGFVTRVAVADNQSVKAGDLLAVIDDRDYQAALTRAQATVQAQEAALANLDAQSSLQAATIEQDQAKVASAEAELHRAQDDAVRSRNLATRRVVSEQDHELTDATATKALADRDAARAAVVAAQRQLTVLATERKQGEAILAQEQASLQLARLNLSYTEIRSPIDGVVGNRRLRVGDYTTVGAQLLSIVPATGLYVEANFKESQIAHMRAGQAVRIQADVLSGVKFTGRVDSLAPATGAEFSLLPAENATGNFTKIVQRVPIRILLDGDSANLGRLRPGLSVIARVDLR